MYKDNKILCVIPARGGSKGLPGKNIKDLCGKPLIAHSIEQAKRSRYIDRLIVSTDDENIAAVAGQYGAQIPFVRPSHLAQDSTGIIDVLLHAADWMEQKENFCFDILVLLHVTACLRIPEDIDNCIERIVDTGCENIFSVTPAHKNPYFNMVERKGNTVGLVKRGSFVTRQSAPDVYDMNCSIYVWWKDVLRSKRGLFLDKTDIYIMPKERSVDVDDHWDFKVMEMMMKEKVGRVKKY